MGKICKRWLVLLLVLALLVTVASELWLMPMLDTFGDYHAQRLYDGTVSGYVAEIMQEYGLSEDNLVSMRTDQSGEITAVTPNTVSLNLIQSKLNERMSAQLRSVEGIRYEVPWGSVFGGVWLTGLGPKLTFRLTADSLVTVGLEDTVTAVGINQTCYSLSVTVDQDVLLVYAGRCRMLTMHSKALVAQTVLVGEIPQTYVDYQEGN
ncbi:MAG: hypothetical protein IJC17_06490 [Clostridia bacterium]|nr:hypothetical protein [Clostridia bacterium]